MNTNSLGLVIFALIALAAVFAFIFVLGGPEPEKTGQLAGTQKIGASYYKYRDAWDACTRGGAHCSNGMEAIPTGRYDPYIGAYECRCTTADGPLDWKQDQNLHLWRTPYGPPG